MMGLSKKEGSQKVRGDVAFDLDAVAARPMAFIYRGREHVIKPMTVEQFAQSQAILPILLKLYKTEELADEEVIDAYFQFFSFMCDTLTREDIAKMDRKQAEYLVTQLAKHIAGEELIEEQKKN
jgi:hypothetical protein